MLCPVLKRASWAASDDQHSFAILEHMIGDRLAQGEFFFAVACPWPVQGMRLQFAGFRIHQHEAAAIGVDRTKHQFENPIEQLARVEDMAGRLARIVHDRQVGQGVFEPGRRLIRLLENPAAFGFADGLDDGRRQLDVSPRDHADLVGQVPGRLRPIGPAAASRPASSGR